MLTLELSGHIVKVYVIFIIVGSVLNNILSTLKDAIWESLTSNNASFSVLHLVQTVFFVFKFASRVPFMNRFYFAVLLIAVSGGHLPAIIEMLVHELKILLHLIIN